ncbi:hypothetical protein V5F79_08365 [Xanthobacter flavus]|uniref:terminase small subunit-like protein n=1 Tax=Xanthobacter flavus TaxID=281 RepID=UPI00372C2DBC
MGRRSIMSESVVRAIRGRLANGESLRSICRAPGMPSKATVYRWIKTRPEFLQAYLSAREVQEFIDDDIACELAMSVADGLADQDTATSMIQHYRWAAGKRKARKYRPGYNPAAPVCADPAPALDVFTPEERMALAALSRKAAGLV